MGLTTLLTMLVIALVSRSEGKGADDAKGITSPGARLPLSRSTTSVPLRC